MNEMKEYDLSKVYREHRKEQAAHKHLEQLAYESKHHRKNADHRLLFYEIRLMLVVIALTLLLFLILQMLTGLPSIL